VLLAICAFSLSLLGTFLVRSGVLTSVHAFATDPRRGVFILAFLALVIGGSLLLFAGARAEGRRRGPLRDRLAGDALLANNVLLIAAAGSVLLGTLYPLFLDALNSRQDLGWTAVLRRRVRAGDDAARFPDGRRPARALEGDEDPGSLAAVALGAAASAVVTALRAPLRRRQVVGGRGRSACCSPRGSPRRPSSTSASAGAACGAAPSRTATAAASYWGMIVAHLGIAVFIVGVTMVKGLRNRTRLEDERRRHRRDWRLHVPLRRHDGNERSELPSRPRHRRRFARRRAFTTLYPEKRTYNRERHAMTEAAIRSMPTGDLYVSLGEPIADGAWSVRIYH
jgi:cytochrome c-type biogenesis protein CcmF